MATSDGQDAGFAEQGVQKGDWTRRVHAIASAKTTTAVRRTATLCEFKPPSRRCASSRRNGAQRSGGRSPGMANKAVLDQSLFSRLRYVK